MDNNLQQSTQQNQSTVQQRKEREPEKLFTQEDVNRIVGERLSRVRQETGDAEAYKRERDEARKELEEYKSNAFLKAQGVREQDMDYVAFKARQLVDDNTDFQQAVEQFLKQEPCWAGKGYRVSTGVSNGGPGTGAVSTGAGDPAVRKAMGLE